MSGQHHDNLVGNQLLMDQGQQLQIRVGDGALRVVEDDEFSYTVIRPLNLSEPIDPFLVGVDPPTPAPTSEASQYPRYEASMWTIYTS